ncbi:MFS transporter [Aurantimonas sp. C2-6-R+9]|uniref:MFS transporter n=1 Tax=unclassified Aurantimonas TaxID=2638230 RepID=UPI002E189960|nr:MULTISPECIES: MFS transporter [unclassified Aurantimonas]MEC5290824.1 MFS transporter [Aurantimonas sp. C2-3-R2]MEC5321821.1 MFS transporter [Aurantimonas sp. A3-2-R12]MEC5380925.1 MFS transporter [Aurantimonas sp. C2-6-R+9]MEC5411936.1 MFS transporter [Aurantimonas sp. C2-4-R8]
MGKWTPDDIVAQAEHEIEQVDWVSAGAAIASISAVGIALGLGLPLLSVILEQRGISASLIGANTAVAGIASLLAAPLITPIARRLGVRLSMLIAIALSGISALGFYFLTPFWTWFPLRLVFHFAITALFVLSEFWITAAAPPGKRGFVLGIYATVLSLGFAAGPFIFSQVGSTGILPFAIGAGVIFASAIPLFFAWNRQPALGERQRGSFWRYIFAVPTATGAVLIFGAVESGGFALFPIYGERLGFSESSAALLLTAIGLGNVLMQIPIGLVSDRVRDRRSLLSLFALIGLIGTLSLPLVAQDWMLMATLLFLWGGVVAGLYTVGLAHLGSKLAGSELASANAAFIFCYSAGMLVGPQAIGSSMDLFGANGFAWALALFFGLYLVLTLGRMAWARRA